MPWIRSFKGNNYLNAYGSFRIRVFLKHIEVLNMNL